MISVGGRFIDATADILNNWEGFTLKEYFYTESFFYFAITVALWIVSKSLSNLKDYYKGRITSYIELDSFYSIMSKNSELDLQDVESPKFQALMTFATNYSIPKLYEAYDNFSESILYLVRLLSSAVIIYETMGLSVLLISLIAVAEPLVQYIGEKGILKLRRAAVESTKFLEYLGRISVVLTSFAELKVNGIFKYLKATYHQGNRTFRKEVLEKEKHYYIDNAFFAMIGQILFRAYTVYMLYIAVVRDLTIGDFTALFQYADAFYYSSYFVLRKAMQLFENVSYTEEFFQLQDFEGFGFQRGEVKLKSKTPALTFDKVDFAYRSSGNKVLENISFTIKPGEKVAFVGGDGSGKTSLVKALCGLYEIVAGDYTIDGYSIRELAKGELKKRLSFISQDFVRYNFPLKRNIVISGEKKKVNQSLYQTVKKLTGTDRFMKKEGLTDESLLGKYFSNGRDISPGYWQRLALARMLYRNRGVFLMDEPFTFIDGPSREKILDNILDFAGKDRTVIYITQNTDMLKKFDNVYYLHKGKILEQGSYMNLVKKRGKFYSELKGNV